MTFKKKFEKSKKVSKNAEFHADFKSVEKVFKKCTKKDISKTSLTNMSKSGKSAYLSPIFADRGEQTDRQVNSSGADTRTGTPDGCKVIWYQTGVTRQNHMEVDIFFPFFTITVFRMKGKSLVSER